MYADHCLASTLILQKNNDELQQILKNRSKVSRFADVDAILKRATSSKYALEDCNREAALVMKKRRSRFLRLSGQVNIVQRNRERVYSLLSSRLSGELDRPRAEDADLKHEKVVQTRTQREDEETMHKFLLLHRWEINHIYEDLVRKKLEELGEKKRRVQLWVVLMRYKNIGKYLWDKFAVRTLCKRNHRGRSGEQQRRRCGCTMHCTSAYRCDAG
ncbi:MAG: hypothetical protein P4M11_02200 [Candidatus Pacebacteria bacterium]|nr:hypothetical protein [Candidatus Paceibacterota bacterium]